MKPCRLLVDSSMARILFLCLWAGWFSWPFVTDSFDYGGSGYITLFGKWLLLVVVLGVLSLVCRSCDVRDLDQVSDRPRKDL